MDDKDFEDIKNEIEQVIHQCHLAAMRGIAPHTFLRTVATRLEIKYAQREESRSEKDIQKLHDFIEHHFVQAAEKTEHHIAVNLLLATKNIYHAIFNLMILEKVGINHLNEFVKDVLSSRKIPDTLKEEIGQTVLMTIDDWQKELKSIHNNANAIFARAKDRKSVTLALTKMLHTAGGSYLKRRQEINFFRDGQRDEVRAEGIEKEILQMHFPTKEKAEEALEKERQFHERSLQEFANSIRLLATDWESAIDYLESADVEIERAAGMHEIPERSSKQFKDIVSMVVEKIIEPFIHSINEGVNQLDAIREEIKGEGKKLKRAA